MNNRLNYLGPVFIMLLFIQIMSCNTSKIHGLWVVEKVKVGDQTMTPDARWMEFNKANQQRSGNGWNQHSIGTWRYDTKQKSLHVHNINGYIDTNDPFKVKLEHDKMYWTRIEEGQTVLVTLKKANELPSSNRDKLLGVWDLVTATKNKQEITKELDPLDKRYLFVRWDGKFVIQNSPEGRLSGIYSVHAHRPEVELIFNQEENKRRRYTFEVTHNQLKLSANDGSTTLKYNRINHFHQ